MNLQSSECLTFSKRTLRTALISTKRADRLRAQTEMSPTPIAPRRPSSLRNQAMHSSCKDRPLKLPTTIVHASPGRPAPKVAPVDVADENCGEAVGGGMAVKVLVPSNCALINPLMSNSNWSEFSAAYLICCSMSFRNSSTFYSTVCS